MTDYNLERLNFLIVDDNKHMRALVKSILHALGAMSLSLLKFVGQASLVDDAMLPS